MARINEILADALIRIDGRREEREDVLILLDKAIDLIKEENEEAVAIEGSPSACFISMIKTIKTVIVSCGEEIDRSIILTIQSQSFKQEIEFIDKKIEAADAKIEKLSKEEKELNDLMDTIVPRSLKDMLENQGVSMAKKS